MMSILLSVCLVGYIILLIISCKNKDNRNVKTAVMTVQGILWTLVAVDSWGSCHILTKIIYVAIVVLSLTSAVQMVIKKDKMPLRHKM